MYRYSADVLDWSGQGGVVVVGSGKVNFIYIRLPQASWFDNYHFPPFLSSSILRICSHCGYISRNSLSNTLLSFKHRHCPVTGSPSNCVDIISLKFKLNEGVMIAIPPAQPVSHLATTPLASHIYWVGHSGPLGQYVGHIDHQYVDIVYV